MTGISDFYRGDTKKYLFKLRDKETQEPISIDGATLTATLKKKLAQTDLEADLQVSANGVEADPPNPTGEISIIFSKVDTEIAPATYFYDFQLVSSTGEVTTVLSGKVKVLTDATRTS